MSSDMCHVKNTRLHIIHTLGNYYNWDYKYTILKYIQIKKKKKLVSDLSQTQQYIFILFLSRQCILVN
jgi:hypothetical protein